MQPDSEIMSNLPLTEATFLMLLSLRSGPTHGYAILKDVQALSGDRVHLSTGTLYGGIQRMLDRGWIRRAPEADSVEEGRERIAYALNDLGLRILEAEIERLRSLLRVANQVARGESGAA